MATYLFGLFMVVMPSVLDPVPYEGFQSFLMLIFLVTFLLPVVNILMFKLFGSISSLAMPHRRERIVPFILITLLYCAMTYLFHQKVRMDWNDNFIKLLIIIDALVIMSMLATFFYKVSVHSLSVCGLIGIVLPLNKIAEENSIFYSTLALIVIAGVVMSARLQLNAHTPREVLVGSVLGFTTSFAGMLILF
ncbi:MAG: hypothetical protein JNM57_08825 [Cyclobacteriaceae bacterium]|nr:hypothetical protein [Cyclobacteriaceae bacterium]